MYLTYSESLITFLPDKLGKQPFQWKVYKPNFTIISAQWLHSFSTTLQCNIITNNAKYTLKIEQYYIKED
jgi:hypothetical protein